MIESLFLIFLIFILFWQGSLLLAAIKGLPIVYADKNAIRQAIKLANPQKDGLFVDLGCGNGRSLIIAAKEFGMQAIGVDNSLYCVLKSKLNAWINGQSKKIKIIYGDFQKSEQFLEKSDVVYLYLLEPFLAQIETWLFDVINQETKVVSIAFSFKNRVPEKIASTIVLGNNTKIRLYKK